MIKFSIRFLDAVGVAGVAPKAGDLPRLLGLPVVARLLKTKGDRISMELKERS